MALDPNELFVAGTGGLYTAPPGTAFPTDINDPIDEADWDHLGYTTEDGVVLGFDRKTKDIKGWQTSDVLRILVTEEPKSLKTTLIQLNQANCSLAFGGGTHSGGNGVYEFHPTTDGSLAEYSWIVEAVDGDDVIRFCIRNSALNEKVEIPFNADEETQIPISVGFLVPDASYADPDSPTETWFLQHNIVALGEAALGST